MVTVESFRQAFDEFRTTDQQSIEAKLELAKLNVNAGVWGAKRDAGVLYLTAHYISLAPSGQNAKLKPADMALTTYGETYKAMLRSVTFGIRTAGQPPAGVTNGQ